jgi:hypothetical protein
MPPTAPLLEAILMSLVFNSKIVDCSSSYIMLMSWNLLPFSANLIFRKIKKSHDAIYEKWRVHCYGAESISNVSISRSFSLHVFPQMSQDDCRNDVSQFVPVCPLCVTVAGHPECLKFFTHYTLCVYHYWQQNNTQIQSSIMPVTPLWNLTANHSLPFCSLFPHKMKF